MTTQNLKSNLHNLIDSFEDNDVLESLFDALSELKNNSKDIIDDLTEKQLMRLDESIQQVKDGKVIEHDLMRKRIASWLTK